VEGAENGEWIIVDCGAAVAHIMQPTIRDYYRLEEIWGGKSVKMKMDGEAGPLPVKPPPLTHAAGQRAAPARAAKAPAGARKKPAAVKRRSPVKKPVATKKTAAGVRKTARKSTARTR
jgi:ribosome-associated protein